ncbi:MAG: NifU family protein [Verrucomicrobia bacterium]|nr:NifU family protein [Verrucomicrobiota bacterium]
MNKDVFYLPYPWAHYSKKLAYKIEHPQFAGFFLPEDTLGRGVRLVIGREGSIAEGNAVTMYWLVDESDGIISDIRYQVFGASALIGALEAACQLLLRKNYDQARRISADLIDREVRDKSDAEAFPREVYGHLNLVLSAIETASEQCTDIPFDEVYIDSPLHPDTVSAGLYPGWENLPQADKIRVIEEVIQKEIRPYIELDAGGIQIMGLSDQYQLTIAYQGSCTTCYSATGSTLNAIQQILQTRVHPSIQVIPDLSFLKQ